MKKHKTLVLLLVLLSLLSCNLVRSKYKSNTSYIKFIHHNQRFIYHEYDWSNNCTDKGFYSVKGDTLILLYDRLILNPHKYTNSLDSFPKNGETCTIDISFYDIHSGKPIKGAKILLGDTNTHIHKKVQFKSRGRCIIRSKIDTGDIGVLLGKPGYDYLFRNYSAHKSYIQKIYVTPAYKPQCHETEIDKFIVIKVVKDTLIIKDIQTGTVHKYIN